MEVDDGLIFICSSGKIFSIDMDEFVQHKKNALSVIEVSFLKYTYDNYPLF